MCRRFNFRDEPQANVSPFSKTAGGLLDQGKLNNRINLYRIDLGIDRELKFPDLFSGSVEDDLVADESGLESFPQLPAGVDLDIACSVFHRTQNAHRRHRFCRIAKLNWTINY